MCLAIPARVVGLFPDDQDHALVEVAGVRRQIDTGLLLDDPVKEGDWVLIHVGFAMSKISEEDAIEQFRILNVLGERETAEEEMRGYGLYET